MSTYNVVIRATITKTISVEADSLEEAERQAHEEFDVVSDKHHENYEQVTLDNELVDY